MISKIMEEFTSFDALGNKYFYKDIEKRILHNERGPSIQKVDGTNVFYIDGLWVTEEWYTKQFPDWKKLNTQVD